MSRVYFRRNNQVLPYLFLTPALVFLALFMAYPLTETVVKSFYAYDLTSRVLNLVGISNYIELVHDPMFQTAAKNAILFLIFSVLVQIPLGTVLAAVLDRGVTSNASLTFRTIIFSPLVLSIVAVGLLWQLILDPLVGLASAVVKAVGLHPPPLGWLGDPKIAIYVIMAIAFWQYIGFVTLLMFAGLQRIPEELYQAATLDGAGPITSFWYVSLPMVQNALIVTSLLTMIGALRVFDFVYILTGGGPANATQVPATMIYKEAFFLGRMGYANAVSVLLLLATVGLGFVQIRFSRHS
ncbi:MAG: sugar ABC transporter permease [Verrucomicrobia bacterium]|nr:sugar ABC transporter permease [Verrucomicrobiota bacterium]